MDKSSDPANGHWRVDKSIPLALILAILVQTGAGFWWASSISERVSSLERWRTANENVASDIAVMKSQVEDIKESVKRIEGALTDGRGR